MALPRRCLAQAYLTSTLTALTRLNLTHFNLPCLCVPLPALPRFAGMRWGRASSSTYSRMASRPTPSSFTSSRQVSWPSALGPCSPQDLTTLCPSVQLVLTTAASPSYSLPITGKYALDMIHKALLGYHREALEKASKQSGTNLTAVVAKMRPELALLSYWGPQTPGYGGAIHMTRPGALVAETDLAPAAMAPFGATHDIYIANEAYGALRGSDGVLGEHHGWAECSLVISLALKRHTAARSSLYHMPCVILLCLAVQHCDRNFALPAVSWPELAYLGRTGDGRECAHRAVWPLPARMDQQLCV